MSCTYLQEQYQYHFSAVCAGDVSHSNTSMKEEIRWSTSHKDQLQYYSINLHVFTGVLVANQAVTILNYKMFLGNTDFTLFIAICQSCSGYHQKQLLSFPFQPQSILRSPRMCIVWKLRILLVCLILKYSNHSIHRVKAQLLSSPSYTIEENLWLHTERLEKKEHFQMKTYAFICWHTLMIWNILSVGYSLLYFSLLSFKSIQHHLNKVVFLLSLGPHFCYTINVWRNALYSFRNVFAARHNCILSFW